MKFFNPEDFNPTNSSLYMDMKKAKEAADIANAKLEREGKVVYARQYGVGKFDSWSDSGFRSEHEGQCNVKALLINIEPIEKCTHPDKSVKPKQDIGGIWFECQCGARVVPTEFKEQQV